MKWMAVKCSVPYTTRLSFPSDELGMPQCHSRKGPRPEMLAETMDQVERMALQLGWTRVKGLGWVCPFCKHELDKR